MQEGRTMRGVMFLALLLASSAGLLQAQSSIFSGYLGCHFSQTVCRQNEECVDDRLFGTCQRVDRPQDSYQYYLNSSQLRGLERELGHLIRSGSTWDDLFTQCVLSNILLSYRHGGSYDSELCDSGGVSQELLESSLTDQTVELLNNYLDQYYRSEPLYDDGQEEFPALNDDALEFPNPDMKKDEVVQVHKYLKSHKRDPFLDGDNEEYPDVDYGLEYPEYEDAYDMRDLLEGLSPEKLSLLQEYLGPGDGQDNSSPIPQTGDAGLFEDPSNQVDLTNLPEGVNYVKIAMEIDDGQLLDDLLQGRLKVSNLTDDEISRLTKYVDSFLETLRSGSPQPDDVMGDYVGLEAIDDSPALSSLPEPPLDDTVDSDADPDLLHAVKKEQMNADALRDTEPGNSVVRVDVVRDPIVKKDRTSLTAEDMEDEDVDDKADPQDNGSPDQLIPTTHPKYGVIDMGITYLKISPDLETEEDAKKILNVLLDDLQIPEDAISDIKVTKGEISFQVDEKLLGGLNASELAAKAMADAANVKNQTSFTIYQAGVGRHEAQVSVEENTNEPKYIVLTLVLSGVIAAIVLAVIAIYIVRRHLQSKEKLAKLAGAADSVEASNDYQDLCRQRMQTKSSEKPEPLHVAARVGSVSTMETAARSPSSRSSTSSWSEEPVTSNMDISTGHIVLSYMEDHLKNKSRLDQEWEALCSYDAEPNAITTASEQSNMRKNRYSDVLPYDHSRVVINSATNVSGSDYINASTITDHDPRNPAYIATQGPLPHTVADFWQMIWEQGSIVIVNLTRLTETGQAMCHRYWPEEGSDLYHIYEVHLVSEHIWCDDYLVRSFYLKNLQTNETRTVTQFNFLTWPDLGIPGSAKALLDFRRKVNKSYRGRSCPIVVHCSDGSGRSGTYTLLDMVLNRMGKGAKEIDIAATLEHIRDQRMLMVKTKEQFEFALAAVAEEVHAILKALPQ